MSADYSAIETAIYTWASTESALETIWASQTKDAIKPSSQHVLLQLADQTTLGSTPDNTREYDAGADNGEEITHTLTDVNRVMLSVQIIGGDTNGNSSSRVKAIALQKSLSKTSVREALAAVGCSIIDKGSVQHLPAILDADFEARSVFDIEMLVSDSTSEQTGYIGTIEIEDTLTEVVSSVTLP